ncbi:MAG TPA: prepilin-type N-terminal cleavage/methylation domain-containing protein [bacterium]|nr:prepilin-type N-terminal cleavage/methylation domain-containing protein [bacterium]
MSRRAFTIVELMVVIALISVTAVLSMPRVNEWIARQQAKRVISQLITDYSKAVALSSKSTMHTSTGGSYTNRAAIYFQNADGKHAYSILLRNNGSNASWSMNDPVVKFVRLPGRVSFTNINETSFGSTAATAISFTSTGIALDNANTMLNLKSFYDVPSNCGGQTSNKKYSARIDLRADISDSKALFYRVEINQFGEYRICASFGDANFASNGLEVRGI